MLSSPLPLSSVSFSSFNIWKDNVNNDNNNNNNNKDVSPFYDIPLCFHKDFSSDKRISSAEHAKNKGRSVPIQVYKVSSRKILHSYLSSLSSSEQSPISTIEPLTLIDDNNDSFAYHSLTSSSSSSSSDVTKALPKKIKLINKEILIEKHSPLHHQSREKSTSMNNKPNTSKQRYKLSRITICQFIKDITTNIETLIESTTPNKQISTYQLKSPVQQHHLELTSPVHSQHQQELSILPTVPRCLNEYCQINFNFLSHHKSHDFESSLKLNLFDSSLFQWEIFNKNQTKNYFCRKHLSSAIVDQVQSPIHSLINYIQSQRQFVPMEYTSWNKVFPNYQPFEFGPKTKPLLRNPYGRTGLLGRSLLEHIGINRYIISLITKEHNNSKYMLLIKNLSHQWTLPKTKTIDRRIPYQTLDIAYIDHPLNTDSAWIEVQIILIENVKQYSRKKTWFIMEYLDKLNNIERFDFDLIKFYM